MLIVQSVKELWYVKECVFNGGHLECLRVGEEKSKQLKSTELPEAAMSKKEDTYILLYFRF